MSNYQFLIYLFFISLFLGCSSDDSGSSNITGPGGEEISIYRLQSDNADDLFPQWSSDGENIFFTSNRDNMLSYDWVGSIYSMPAGGGEATKLAIDNTEIHQFAISPDGQYVAFYAGDNEDVCHLYLASLSGGVSELIEEDVATNVKAAWSPDGTKIAFESSKGGFPDIYIYDMSTESVSNLTQTQGHSERDPSFSPDGNYIFYSSTRVGRYNIFERSLEDGTERQITPTSFLNSYSPVCSPDGTTIAYTQHDGVQRDVLLIPREGGEAVNITNNLDNEEYPSWSPDGTKIVYYRRYRMNIDIWIIDLSAG